MLSKAFGKLVFVLLIHTFASASNSAENKQHTEKESPWILVPTLSGDPKLGASLGAIGGYLHRFDAESTQSMFLLTGSYSSTDSWVSGIFGQMYFDKNHQKLILGIAGGTIRNDYNDFLGSGIPAQTTDNLKITIARYSRIVAENWYIGGQLISSNYTIGAEGFAGDWLEFIGLTGFDSSGIGLVAEYDTRDNSRNPKEGDNFVFHNVAYRKSLGGDESFDVYNIEYKNFRNYTKENVFAMQLSGRWTSDAPIGGYSSVKLRGYVRGNYLAPHYSHIDLENRFAFNSTWGMSIFAGLACLYEDIDNCTESENLYGSAGAGIIYALKPKAGIVIRTEFAKGEADEYVWYLKMGNSF